MADQQPAAISPDALEALEALARISARLAICLDCEYCSARANADTAIAVSQVDPE